MTETSLLGYALLGLIRQEPASGYSLRKIFATTAMGSFSDSPGAIYPALRRLEKDGLVLGSTEGGLRRRTTFRLSPEGSSALEGWLSKPVSRDDVIRGMGAVMLRFAFLDSDPEAAIRLLQSLRSQLMPYIAELETYAIAHASTMPLSGQLALDHGIRGYRSSLEWAEDAIATLSQQHERKI